MFPRQGLKSNPLAIACLAAMAAAGASVADIPRAEAATAVHTGNLGQFCARKYGPNASGERINWTRWGPQLQCRIPGSTYGYVKHNQSANEVCRFLTGNGAWAASSGRVICQGGNSGSVARPAFQIRQPAFQPQRQRCVRYGYRYICR